MALWGRFIREGEIVYYKMGRTDNVIYHVATMGKGAERAPR